MVELYGLNEIADLRPDPENPREVSAAALEGLKYSVESFGDLSGIVWNERSGTLVCGHQRLKALIDAGAKFVTYDGVPTLTIEETGFDFDVRVVDWPREKHLEAMVAANNEATMGHWTSKAADIAKRIRESSADRYKSLRIAEILKAAPRIPRAIVEDDAPEPPKTPITKPGDIWTLGRHTVGCASAAVTGVPAQTVAVVTDPPYTNRTHAGMRSGNNPGMGPLDDRGRAKRGLEYAPIDQETIKVVSRLWMEPNCWIVLFSDHVGWQEWNNAITNFGLYTFGPVGWVKPLAPPRFGGDGPTSSVEWILVARPKRQPTDRRSRPGHYIADKVADSLLVGQKPVSTIAALIEDYSRPGDMVADPFLGTGTAVIACEQTDRVCYGSEMEPKRVDIAIERWENLTGGKAKRG